MYLIVGTSLATCLPTSQCTVPVISSCLFGNTRTACVSAPSCPLFFFMCVLLQPLDLEDAMTESEALAAIRKIADKNQVRKKTQGR